MPDTHYAVVVGINRYPALGDLRGPVGDADSFAEWLIEAEGGDLPKENIYRVEVTPDAARDLPAHAAKPAVPEIIDALRDVNEAVRERTAENPAAWQHTRLYLFVAGHGMLPADSDAALFTANASESELGHNIDLRLYQQWYRRCGCFRELVVFADCCRNHIDDAVSQGPPFTPCRNIDRPVRVAVGYGAEFGRRAYEDPLDADDPDRRRGYFTTALLRGLRRPRPIGSPPQRWDELRAFINETLPNLARVNNREQAAEMTGADDLVFGSAAGIAGDGRRAVAMSFPPGLNDLVDLLDGRLQPSGTWDTRRGTWSLLLPPGLYVVVRHQTLDPIGSGFTVAGADIDVAL